MTHLFPCPFCGSTSVDPEGWASTERAGPACDDCAGTADTVELWNTRPVTREVVAAVAADKCFSCGVYSFESCPRSKKADCGREFHGGSRKASTLPSQERGTAT